MNGPRLGSVYHYEGQSFTFHGYGMDLEPRITYIKPVSGDPQWKPEYGDISRAIILPSSKRR